MAQLLRAEDGPDLIRRKVDHLSVMAGAFETIGDRTRHPEANVVQDTPAMQQLAREWPHEVPIIWSGFEVGIATRFPARAILEDLNYVQHHPIREAYLLHSGRDHDRPSWDQTSVLFSIFPDRGYFDLSGPGRVSIADNALTDFDPLDKRWDRSKAKPEPFRLADRPKKPESRDRFLRMSAQQAARVQEAIVQLVVQPPSRLSFPKDRTTKLIFDTDMGNDVDDALALAMIHTLERRGACELLAVTSTKDHPASAAFIDAFNTFYGRPDIPIGAVRNGVTPELGKFAGLAANYPHDLKSGQEAPDAVALLRETLAAQEDGSVTLVQVGFFTNLAALIQSPPDATSPLSGEQLVTKKVKELVVMAGAFQTIRHNNRYREYNVFKHVAPARVVAERWPTPILWSGFEIGITAPYPWQSIMEDFEYARPCTRSRRPTSPTCRSIPMTAPPGTSPPCFTPIYPDSGIL